MMDTKREELLTVVFYSFSVFVILLTRIIGVRHSITGGVLYFIAALIAIIPILRCSYHGILRFFVSFVGVVLVIPFLLWCYSQMLISEIRYYQDHIKNQVKMRMIDLRQDRKSNLGFSGIESVKVESASGTRFIGNATVVETTTQTIR